MLFVQQQEEEPRQVWFSENEGGCRCQVSPTQLSHQLRLCSISKDFRNSSRQMNKNYPCFFICFNILCVHCKQFWGIMRKRGKNENQYLSCFHPPCPARLLSRQKQCRALKVCFSSPIFSRNGKPIVISHQFVSKKTSQELRMLSRSLTDCKSLFLNIMIQVSQFVSNSQLCH